MNGITYRINTLNLSQYPNTAYTGLYGNIATGVGATTTLANTWLGYQNYKLSKDSYNFNKKLSTLNYVNQAKAYNEAIKSKELYRGAEQGISYSKTQEYFKTKEFQSKLVREAL